MPGRAAGRYGRPVRAEPSASVATDDQTLRLMRVITTGFAATLVLVALMEGTTWARSWWLPPSRWWSLFVNAGGPGALRRHLERLRADEV